MKNNEKTYFHSTKPKDFIERYCSRLNINAELTKLSMFIASIIEKNNVIPHFWMPKWCGEVNDPSARELEINVEN